MAGKISPIRRSTTVPAILPQKSPPHSDTKALKSKVGDRWPELLEDLAPTLSEALENNCKHGPCPIHGGDARKALLPVVPWMVIGEVIEISYSVYKVVRDAHEKKEKRRGPQ